MRKYEAHITFPRDFAAQVREAAKFTGWSFSQFDADPVMGDKPFCYLTAYNTDPDALLNNMEAASAFCKLDGIPVLREKIEEIIYDTKTGHDRLTAAPVEEFP